MAFTVRLHYQEATAVTKEMLLDSYNMLLDDSFKTPIFDKDPEVDKRKTKQLLKCFYRVISWYSTKEEMNSVRKVKDD